VTKKDRFYGVDTSIDELASLARSTNTESLVGQLEFQKIPLFPLLSPGACIIKKTSRIHNVRTP
jgi:hypothetical protein